MGDTKKNSTYFATSEFDKILGAIYKRMALQLDIPKLQLTKKGLPMMLKVPSGFHCPISPVLSQLSEVHASAVRSSRLSKGSDFVSGIRLAKG